MEWIYWMLLVLAAVCSMLLAVVGLPGLWLMLIVATGYGWATAWSGIGFWTIGVLLVLAIVAEVIDSVASAFGAQRAGASKRAMLLSVVGAAVGGLLLTGLIPIPIIGTIVGVCLGAFAGAVVGEVVKGKKGDAAVKSGVGAALGRLAGMFVKLVIGVVMLTILAVATLPIWGRPVVRGTAGAAPTATPAGGEVTGLPAPTTSPAPLPESAPATTMEIERR